MHIILKYNRSFQALAKTPIFPTMSCYKENRLIEIMEIFILPWRLEHSNSGGIKQEEKDQHFIPVYKSIIY